jgi:hypothetical protein
MYQSNDIQRRFIQERIDRDIAWADGYRRAEIQRPSVRRSIGRSIIAIGARVAAEPSFELARSR